MKIRKLIDKKSISIKISKLAKKIYIDFKNQSFIILSILNGSFIFTADLSRALSEYTNNFQVCFIRLKSYDNFNSTGKVLWNDSLPDIKGKNLLIIDDIFDTGLTLKTFCNSVREQQPEIVKTAVLLIKEKSEVDEIAIDYHCFKIPDKFVVGYGLDYNEQYRGLPYIGVLEQ